MSPAQAAAARRTGQDVCVVAGPGSGKTRVLIERFRWLIEEQGIAPEQVVAITFTEKAATEMKRRLVRVFEDKPGLRQAVERARVSTIHAFCASLLRDQALAAGIDPRFEVLELSVSLELLASSIDEALENRYRTQTDRMRRFLRALAVSSEKDTFVYDLPTALKTIYEQLRLAGRKPRESLLALPEIDSVWDRLLPLLEEINNEQFGRQSDAKRFGHGQFKRLACDLLASGRQFTSTTLEALRCPSIRLPSLEKNSAAYRYRDEVWNLFELLLGYSLLLHYSAERELIVELLEDIDQLFRSKKRAASGLDFDDLEELAIALLHENPTVAESLRHGIEFILLDESQDMNPLQWHLISLLRSPGNLFAVGDLNQSIYGFRFAQPELFHGYRRDLESEGLAVDELRENYRSSVPVIDGLNQLFTPAPPGIEAHELIAASTEFEPSNAPRMEAIIAVGPNAETTERIEALWIATRITELVGTLDLKNGKADYKDIAILTRTNSAAGDLQEALDEFGIPVVILGGTTFYGTREIRDLLLLMEVLVNPLNEIALAGVLRSPLFGLTDEELFSLTLNAPLPKAVEERDPPGWATVRHLSTYRDLMSPDILLRRVMDECGYEDGLTSRARANIEKLLVTLRQWWNARPRPLREMLLHIENAPPEAEAPPEDFGNAVRLLTLHKSKGLEFPIVFLPFLHRDQVTGVNAYPIVSYTESAGLGVKWRDPETRRPAGDTIWHLNCRSAQFADTEQSDRLLYVGATRAEEHLVFSWCKTDRRGGPLKPWSSLVCEQLKIDDAVVTNEPVETASLRTLTVDRPPSPPARNATTGTREDMLVLDTPPRSGQHDSAESVTSVSTFALCPRKYFLARYLRWATPGIARPGRRSADEDEDSILRDEDLDTDELGIQTHQLLAGEKCDNPSPFASELADRFRVSPLGKAAAKAVKGAKEQDFVFAVQGLVLRGQVDLWYEHRGRVILVDYKTDSITSPVSASQTETYSVQLRLYALGLASLIGCPVDQAYIYYLQPNDAIEIDVHPLAIAGATQVVSDLLQAQDRFEFPLRTGQHCYRCPYFRGACPAESR